MKLSFHSVAADVLLAICSLLVYPPIHAKAGPTQDAGQAGDTASPATNAASADSPADRVKTIDPIDGEIHSLSVRVLDESGEPIAGAEVVPWALRSASGHGMWRPKSFNAGKPPQCKTDADGRAEIPYPKYSNADEEISTKEITLSIDHPDYPLVTYEFVSVPQAESAPHVALLKRGARVEITPFENGEQVSGTDLRAITSSGRWTKTGGQTEVTSAGSLRLPPMDPGPSQILVVRFDGKHVTHFSRVLDLDLAEGQVATESVELRPAVKVTGSLSGNVPRPVKNGKIMVTTVPSTTGGSPSVQWATWEPIADDGTFTISNWPADQSIQIIALCDGFIAESGSPPDGLVETIKNSLRAQVLTPTELKKSIFVRMTPRVRARFTVVDANNLPLTDVKVVAWPNIFWWNAGSQIYGGWPNRTEERLFDPVEQRNVDFRQRNPFESHSDEKGRAEIELPVGNWHIAAGNDFYELPIIGGLRERRIHVELGQSKPHRIRMQEKGTEKLGEWDQLAGVFFGCTTGECLKLLSNPKFRAKMTVARTMLEKAKDPNDPRLQRLIFSIMASAFNDLDDQEEADKWRRKAAEQQAKLASNDSTESSPSATDDRVKQSSP